MLQFEVLINNFNPDILMGGGCLCHSSISMRASRPFSAHDIHMNLIKFNIFFEGNKYFKTRSHLAWTQPILLRWFTSSIQVLNSTLLFISTWTTCVNVLSGSNLFQSSPSCNFFSYPLPLFAFLKFTAVTLPITANLKKSPVLSIDWVWYLQNLVTTFTQTWAIFTSSVISQITDNMISFNVN